MLNQMKEFGEEGLHSVSKKWFPAFYGRPEISHGLQKAIQAYMKGNVWLSLENLSAEFLKWAFHIQIRSTHVTSDNHSLPCLIVAWIKWLQESN